MSRRFLYTSALAVVLVSPAFAADLGHPVYKAPPPAPPPVQDWSGVYVGLEAGYGWGKQNFSAFDPFFASKENEARKEFCGIGPSQPVDNVTFHCGPNATINSVNQSGWLAGGFFGAQKQWGSWVLGIEGDIDAADIKGSTTATAFIGISESGASEGAHQSHTLNTKIDELGTLRGKIGYAWSPNWMIYGTGGLALAHVKSDFSASQNFCLIEGSSRECEPFFGADFLNETLVGGISGSGGTTMFGWALGAGLDYKWQIDQGSAVIFGVEYLHYQFPEHSLAFGGSNLGSGAGSCQEFGCNLPGSFTIGNMTQTVDVIKGRISYLFSIH